MSRVVWVASGTHAALFWGSVVCWPRVFESLGWGGILFGEPKESNMRKLSEFVKETYLEFSCALFWSSGP